MMFYPKARITLLLLIVGAGLVSLSDPGSREVYGQSRAPRRNQINTLQPQARVRLNAALREMQTRGLHPQVNSAFRSRAEQQAIYRCAHNRTCRGRRGIYGARRPGTSMHEAGLAVDIGGVATGGRQNRRLTPKGKQIVPIMQKHGFAWRYGLNDPAHFEASPRVAGYHTEHAAIEAGQRRWLQQKKKKPRPHRRVARQA